MKTTAYLMACLAALAMVSAAPAPAPAPSPADDSRPEIIEIIAPAANAQETLATLNLGAPGSDLSERNKRTIGILRQLFPTLTQIIEQKVQQITSFVLKTFGPVVLRAFLGNRNGGGGGANGGGGGTVELDDDDDDDDDDEPVYSTTTSTTTTTTEAAEPREDTDVNEVTDDDNIERKNDDNADKIEGKSDDNPDIDENKSDANADKIDGKSGDNDDKSGDNDDKSEEEKKRRKRALYFLPNAIADENQLLSGAESQQAEVRVAFGEGASDQQPAASEDQQASAAQNTASIDEISLDDADDTEENRNKRFLSFGGSGDSSGGGSGNFLFDIVRLVAGSSSGSSSDSGAGEGDENGSAKGDNLTEGVPGPITRLFIIANRGIANLIQDLILRIAQTSERIVNFKARLITSII